MESFIKSLTARGQTCIYERLKNFKMCPHDVPIIKCTFIPKHGWDITEAEAIKFITLMNGKVKHIIKQPGDASKYGFDAYDIIWIEYIVKKV